MKSAVEAGDASQKRKWAASRFRNVGPGFARHDPEVPIDVIGRDEVFQRDGDRLVEATGLDGAEHGALRGTDRCGTGSFAAGQMAITGDVMVPAFPARGRPAPPRSFRGRAAR